MKRLAQCIAFIVIVLTLPQLWEFSVFLTDKILAPQIGWEMANYALYVIFFAVVLAAFFASQMGTASSFMMIFVMFATRIF